MFRGRLKAKKIYDIYWESNFSFKKDESEKLLLNFVMKKYYIYENDLGYIDIVKSKLKSKKTMNIKANLLRDSDYDGGPGNWTIDKNVDTEISKKLLLDITMKKYDISNKDLEDISIVKSKLRESNIDDILDERPFWKKLF